MKRVGLLVFLTVTLATFSLSGWRLAAAAQPTRIERYVLSAGPAQPASNGHAHGMDSQSAGRSAASLPRMANAGATILFGGLLGSIYSPAEIHIRPGQSVTWQGDFTFHPLVSEDGLWTTVSAGTVFSHTFNTVGTYNFHCFVHGAFGMTGSVTVDKSVIYIPLAEK